MPNGKPLTLTVDSIPQTVSLVRHNPIRGCVFPHDSMVEIIGKCDYLVRYGYAKTHGSVSVAPITPDERVIGHTETIDYLLGLIGASCPKKFSIGDQEHTSEELKTKLVAKRELVVASNGKLKWVVAGGHQRTNEYLVLWALDRKINRIKIPVVHIDRSELFDSNVGENSMHGLGKPVTVGGQMFACCLLLEKYPDLEAVDIRKRLGLVPADQGKLQCIYGGGCALRNIRHPLENETEKEAARAEFYECGFGTRIKNKHGKLCQDAKTFAEVEEIVGSDPQSQINKTKREKLIKKNKAIVNPFAVALCKAIDDGDEKRFASLLVMTLQVVITEFWPADFQYLKTIPKKEKEKVEATK